MLPHPPHPLDWSSRGEAQVPSSSIRRCVALKVADPWGPSTRTTGLRPNEYVLTIGRGPSSVATSSPTRRSSIGRHDQSAIRIGVPRATQYWNSADWNWYLSLSCSRYPNANVAGAPVVVNVNVLVVSFQRAFVPCSHWRARSMIAPGFDRSWYVFRMISAE